MTGLAWLRRGALALAAALWLTPAQGAVAEDTVCPSEPMRIVVLGDSLADGLWGSLFRTYARCDTVDTVRLTAVSDGLAKTGSDDWLDRYTTNSAALESTKNDVVIVQIGANDITTIREGRTRESFATETWNKLYSDRVSGLAQGLKARAGKVIWFGLPIVGNSNLEDPYQAISKLQQSAVGQAGGTFIDIHDLTKFGTGDFAMNGSFGGKLQQLRAPDKVHFTKAGYDFVAQEVLDDLISITRNRDRRAALQNVELQ